MFEKDKTYTLSEFEGHKLHHSGVKILILADNIQYEFHPSSRGYMLYQVDDEEVNPVVRIGPNGLRYFNILEQHIKLLSHLYLSWELTDHGHGVPCVDIKRPYGNSCIIEDIIDILGLNHKWDESIGGYPDWVEAKIRQLHHEVLIALQILCRNGHIEVDEYCANMYDQNWKKVSTFEGKGDN